MVKANQVVPDFLHDMAQRYAEHRERNGYSSLQGRERRGGQLSCIFIDHMNKALLNNLFL